MESDVAVNENHILRPLREERENPQMSFASGCTHFELIVVEHNSGCCCCGAEVCLSVHFAMLLCRVVVSVYKWLLAGGRKIRHRL